MSEKIRAVIFKQAKRNPRYADYKPSLSLSEKTFTMIVDLLNEEVPNWEYSYLTRGQFKSKLEELYSNHVYINNEVKRCFNED